MTQAAVGVSAEHTFQVAEADTAVALGSGDVPVLATPRLLAWAEAMTIRAIAGSLAEADTSVGSHVDLDHRLPSPVGAAVRVVARLAAVDRRRLHFEVTAAHEDGSVAATGVVDRVIVQRERFLARAGG